MTDTATDLLLLPGLLNDQALWAEQIQALSNQVHCHVGDLTTGDSLETVAAAVLAAAPPRFALAGFSLGGYIAQQILRMAPDRVQRLALLDTSIRADSPERLAQRQLLARTARVPGTFHGFGEKLMRSYVAPSRLQDHDLLERVRAMTTRLGAEVFARQSQIARVDGHDVLRAWRGPMLVLCGADDAITPPALHHEMAALVPGARLVEIPDCGHLSPLEQPQAVTTALRQWLAEPAL
ncbi:MAG TPA: alpha/beta fold hydrolase [Stenotrophomonas sp.]|nr:alpha/beta fold hydrolase [Stenotrophomonas sp.]